ncbi:hypothetical protein PoMZ_05697 [Pyricularia oryzae]|uniref:Uncharacterized protein n=1 Tax=Pyricularia oryzae TaxID=318829 RepID=A0A4P7NQG4_PYROR|nr:hypothetical protein PoMZ_05697 [Pyricularia oryzae]
MSASASPRRTEQSLSAGLTPLQKSLNPHIIGTPLAMHIFIDA